MEALQTTKETTAVNLSDFLDDGDDAVVTLVAGETRLVAHRAVLMDRSPVFHAMFAHDTLEASSSQVTIADVEGPVLRQLLSYLYTLRAPQLPSIAPQLLAAADKYGVASLKALILGEIGTHKTTTGKKSESLCPQSPELRSRRHIMPHFKQSSTVEAIQNAKETTAVDLGALLDACDDAVVTLVAGDTRLLAHRAILMDRSPVFAAMFRHDTLESHSGQVNIVDVEGSVLRQLLSYLYTLRASKLPVMATQLLAAADKYGVDGLKVACEQQVAAQLSVETAVAAAVLAVRYSCESLRQASVTFLMNHTHQVMTACGWSDAMPDDLMEVNRLLVAEFRSLPAEERSRRLIQAAKKGTVGEMEALLAAGADVAAVDGERWRRTALHWAAWEGHVEAVRWLVARGAPVDVRDNGQRTPLNWAVLRGSAPVVRLLLAASADHSARTPNGWTPLHYAARLGYAEAAAALLEAGADRAARSGDGMTPLDFARQKKHQQLVEMLTRN